MLELDSWDISETSKEWSSSFDEVTRSKWVASLGGKVTHEHRHFRLQTYDDVFEVVCSGYDFEVLGDA